MIVHIMQLQLVLLRYNRVYAQHQILHELSQELHKSELDYHLHAVLELIPGDFALVHVAPADINDAACAYEGHCVWVEVLLGKFEHVLEDCCEEVTILVIVDAMDYAIS